MKKLLLIFIFAFQLSDAQINMDSLILNNKENIENIQLNLSRSSYEYNFGLVLIGSGLWIDVIGLIGSNQGFINQDQAKAFYLIGGACQLSGLGFVIYSHTFINKASLKVSINKLIYTFK